MVASVLLWLALFDASRLQAIGGDALAAVMYVSNWRFIFHQVSYFEQFGPPSPLGHLWSLAVEEQFYLLWPFLLSLGLRFAPRRGQLAGLTLIAAAVSALAMALLYVPGSDPSRVYYGTDTRAFGLLIGAALAMVWPSRLLSDKISSGRRYIMDVIGGAGLLAVLLMIVLTDQYDDFLYRGGLVLLSVITAVVVAAVVHPASRLNRALSWKPLRWLGVRSYGIYLWHFPVIALSESSSHGIGPDIPRMLLQVSICIGLAALSWRFIEEPIRRGAAVAQQSLSERKGLGKGQTSVFSIPRIPDANRDRPRDYNLAGFVKRKARWLAPACALLLIVTFSFAIAGSASDEPSGIDDSIAEAGQRHPSTPTTSPENGSAGDASPSPTPGASPDVTPPAGEEEPTGKPDDKSQGNTAEKPNPTASPNDKLVTVPSATPGGAESPVPQSGKGITVIGDSVMLGVSPYLEELFPGISIDAKIGRQMSHAQALTEQLKADKKLGKTVVIELGTNGTFRNSQLEELLNTIGGDRTILLINTRVPRPWEDDVNRKLADTAERFPNAKLLDWHAASKGKDYFNSDGVHLTAEGAKAYASLIEKTLAVPKAGK
ncbi:MAG: acetyltransferase, partial [Paenibacillus sp.]|nr:acetyltransferase [Paenibacillus sp.]